MRYRQHIEDIESTQKIQKVRKRVSEEAPKRGLREKNLHIELLDC